MRLMRLLSLLLALPSAQAQFASDRYVPEAIYARLGVTEVLQEEHPGGEKIRYWYNAQGKEMASESSSGIHIRRSYDSLGRLELVFTRFYYEKELVQVEAALYEYHAGDTLPYSQEVMDDKGILQYRYAYAYDSAGRLQREEYFRPDTLVQSYLHTYNGLGKVQEVQVRDALGALEETWAYTYDAQGNMHSFRNTPSPVSSRAPNYQEFDYNASGLRIQQRVIDPMGKLQQRYRMRYDADGLLLQEDGYFPNEVKGEQERVIRYKYVRAGH